MDYLDFFSVPNIYFLLTLGLWSRGIRLANCAIVVDAVFHTSVSTRECSLTPGHGMVTFLPASAFTFT